MGGRGTFAAGNPVEYVYEYANEEINGVKVLKGKKIPGQKTEHGLPESSHSSSAYIKLDQNGNFKEMRLYDKNHCLYLELAYHSERNLGPGKILHYHTYDPSFSLTTEGGGGRSKAIKMTKAMKKHFKKYFKGVKI